jgi:MscS family membrane protein
MYEQLLSSFEGNSILYRVIIVLGLTLGVSLLARLLTRSFINKTDKTITPWDDAFAHAVGLPARVMIWVVGLALAFDIAKAGEGGAVEEMVFAGRDLAVIFSITWFLIRFINIAQVNLVEDQVRKTKKFDHSAVDGLAKLLRLTVFLVSGLVALQTMGFSIAGVLTFGGIGGIAIGFAAQDMLSNFFGGLMIYLDRPFKVGDWIRSPDREIEGVVEDIGWRITCIRNFDSRPLYVPNASFSTISIENVSRMTNRRIYETIGIRYADASAIDLIVEQTTAYLKGHSEIDQEQTLMVSFTTFAPSSLEFFVYCYTRTQSGPVFYRIKQEVMLHILGIIEDNGAECAFPSTTIYMDGGKAPKGAANQAD